MSYHAEVYKVMIASPGDVEKERQLIRNVIHDWNVVHAEERKTVLLPIGWETHSSPEMGMRAQEVINKQVLRDCDLLIAVFWTRLGSPTGNAVSGTVEEIEEHISSGKPAMIYFSSQPVRPDSVDHTQYEALQNFKAECKAKGLIDDYEDLADFKDKLTRQLSQTVIRNFSPASNDEEPEPSFVDRIPAEWRNRYLNPSGSYSLSNDARELLLEARNDQKGLILHLHTRGGTSLRTNDQEFIADRAPQADAKWDAAIRQLEESGLIRAQDNKREVYQVTDNGYTASDDFMADSPETAKRRKVRKILGMRGDVITLRWLNPPDKTALLGRVRGEGEMIVRECDEDVVSLEAPMGAGTQSLPLENILSGFDDQRHRPALEVKP